MEAAILTFAIVLFLALGVLRILLSEHPSHDDVLKPILEAHGLILLSSRSRSLFRRGPFPRVEIRRIKQTKFEILGFDMRSPEPQITRPVRVVRFRTHDGKEHEAWARITFHDQEPICVHWHPELSTFSSRGPVT